MISHNHLEEFTDLISQALAHYDIGVAGTSRINTLWNTLIRVKAAGGADYALRLCNRVVQDQSLVEHELAFLAFIAGRGDIRVPTPVRNREGAWVTVISSAQGPQLACLFHWIEGQDLRGRVTPKHARDMGRVAARLHDAARAYAFPAEDDGIRPDYRYDEPLLLLHHEWIDLHQQVIGQKHSAALHAAVNRTATRMGAIAKTRASYGFIHADLHPGNFVSTGPHLALLDFDQLGRGHFAYDLANLRAELRNERNQPAVDEALWQAAQAGYREIRPLPFENDAALEPFVVAVALGFLDWYYNSPNPAVRIRHERRFASALSALMLASE